VTPARDLVARRHELIHRSRVLRSQLVNDASAFSPVLTSADRVREGVHWLKQHPLWVGVAVAVLVASRPSRLWRWGRKAWTVWRFWQRLRGAAGSFR